MLFQFMGLHEKNLDQSIYHSSDGHKWATHSEAVDRCLSLHEEPKYLKLIKAISVLDLFKEQSGLYPTKPILESLRIFQDSKDLDFALESLEAKSLIVYRTFNESFSIFAGSDFDIETEIAKELANVTTKKQRCHSCVCEKTLSSHWNKSLVYNQAFDFS